MVGAAWDKGKGNKGFPVPKGNGKGKDKKGPNQWIDRTNTTQQGQSWSSNYRWTPESKGSSQKGKGKSAKSGEKGKSTSYPEMEVVLIADQKITWFAIVQTKCK